MFLAIEWRRYEAICAARKSISTARYNRIHGNTSAIPYLLTVAARYRMNAQAYDDQLSMLASLYSPERFLSNY